MTARKFLRAMVALASRNAAAKIASPTKIITGSHRFFLYIVTGRTYSTYRSAFASVQRPPWRQRFASDRGGRNPFRCPMGALISYRFKDFPLLEDGRETPKSGSIVAAATRIPGSGIRDWHAVRIVLDGVESLSLSTRAQVEMWLHEMRGHNSAIQRGLSSRTRP